MIGKCRVDSHSIHMMRSVDTKATIHAIISAIYLSQYRIRKLAYRETHEPNDSGSINQQDIKSLLSAPAHRIQSSTNQSLHRRQWSVRSRQRDARAVRYRDSLQTLLHHLMTGKLRVRDLDPTDHSHDGTAAG